VSHVLLKWRGLKGEDEFERPGKPAPTRTQAEAERELLELMEELLAAGDHKTLGARFKVEVLKRSECSTALNVPYADLGWVEPGGAEPAMVAAAFDTPAGGLSDVVMTSRGAHLMYRLA
jgi:parvulin-like peptidyl-prolyl isomerase